MTFKSIIKYGFMTGAGLILLGLVLIPHVFQWGINTVLSTRPGLDDLKISVRHVGLTGAGIGPIYMGSHLVADGVTATYSPGSLIRQRPRQITVSGLDIRASLSRGGIVLTDFAPLFFNKENSSTPPADDLSRPSMDAVFARLPSRMNISHSRFSLFFNGREIIIPFDLSALVPRDKQSVSMGFHLFPLGQPVHGAVVMNNAGDIEHFELTARGIEYGRFNDILKLWFPEISLQGKGDLTLTGDGEGRASLRISRLALAEPRPICLDNLAVTLVPGKGPAIPGLPLRFPLHALFHFQWDRGGLPTLFMSGRVDCTREGAWKLTLMDQHKKNSEYFFRLGKTELSMGPGSRFQLDVTGQKTKGTLRLHMVANELMVQNIPLPVRVSRVGLNGTGTFDFSSRGKGFAMDLTTTLGRIQGENRQFQIRFPGASIPFAVRVTHRGKPSVSGAIKIRNGNVSQLGRDSLVISGLNLHMPFFWPRGISGRRGTFSGETISFNGAPVCSLEGKMIHTEKGMDISGAVHFPFWGTVPPMAGSAVSSKAMFPHVKFDLKTVFLPPLAPAMALTWDMPPFFLTHDMVKKSGLLSPDVVLPRFNTTLAARGHMDFGGEKTKNRLVLDLTRGQVDMPDKKLAIKGINAGLILNELPLVRSAPGMVLTMDSLDFNGIILTDAKLRYTLESATSFLLENASFKWCNGGVSAGATRFSSDVDAYRLTLFCDRLRFADMLQQMGSFKARGEGSLNGTIPISWVDGMLSFDNGFLYSTPGVGGTIQVSNTEVFTAGIPMDTPRFVQMDLAREALKNYTYKWARVGFNSQGEDLMVKLQFDGSPGENLPFVYRKDLGRFIRVDAAAPGSRFQGIKLDVNLTLPFHRVLKLGNELNDFMEKF